MCKCKCMCMCMRMCMCMCMRVRVREGTLESLARPCNEERNNTPHLTLASASSLPPTPSHNVLASLEPHVPPSLTNSLPPTFPPRTVTHKPIEEAITAEGTSVQREEASVREREGGAVRKHSLDAMGDCDVEKEHIERISILVAISSCVRPSP